MIPSHVRAPGLVWSGLSLVFTQSVPPGEPLIEAA